MTTVSRHIRMPKRLDDLLAQEARDTDRSYSRVLIRKLEIALKKGQENSEILLDEVPQNGHKEPSAQD